MITSRLVVCRSGRCVDYRKNGSHLLIAESVATARADRSGARCVASTTAIVQTTVRWGVAGRSCIRTRAGVSEHRESMGGVRADGVVLIRGKRRAASVVSGFGSEVNPPAI